MFRQSRHISLTEAILKTVIRHLIIILDGQLLPKPPVVFMQAVYKRLIRTVVTIPNQRV